MIREVGLVLAAGLLAVPVARLTRMPVMLALVGLGLIIGPQATGLVEDPLTGPGAQLAFTFGVALILFHGGVGISLRVISRTAVGLTLLVLPGVALTAFIVALAAGPLFGVSFTVAMLIGAVLAPTDPAILIPLFERIRLRPKLAQTVIAESAFNDPTGTVLALALAGAVGTTGGVGVGGLLGDVGIALALGVAIGVAGGALLALMLSDRRLGMWAQSPLVAVLALVAVDYFTADELGGSAFLAAFVMGLVVGNSDLLRLRQADEHRERLETSVTQVADLAALAVFVTLGVNLPLDAMWDHLGAGLVLLAVFLLVARPVTVLACLLPDRRAGWTRQEIAFMCWSRETGVVPAALAGLLLSRGVEGAEIAAAMVAIAVIATLLLQAGTAEMLARRLGLLQEGIPLARETVTVPGVSGAGTGGHGI